MVTQLPLQKKNTHAECNSNSIGDSNRASPAAVVANDSIEMAEGAVSIKIPKSLAQMPI